jgi:hypothetical protein
MSSLAEAVMEALVGKNKKNKNKKNSYTYQTFSYTDPKTKQKKYVQLAISDPDGVNDIGESIFGARYYTLSEDPLYMSEIDGILHTAGT